MSKRNKLTQRRETDPGIKWFNCRWYPSHKQEGSVQYHTADGTLTRLRKPQVTLFTPWGPCYHPESLATRGYDRERRTLAFLAETLWQLEMNLPREWRWILLGADLYGTRLNGLSDEAVHTYFAKVSMLVHEYLPQAEWHLWSAYDTLVQTKRGQAEAELPRRISGTVKQRAKHTSERRGFGSFESYLIERLTEAFYVEETWAPIKLSLAPRHKDSEVDAELPRLYVVPPELRTPWLF